MLGVCTVVFSEWGWRQAVWRLLMPLAFAVTAYAVTTLWGRRISASLSCLSVWRLVLAISSVCLWWPGYGVPSAARDLATAAWFFSASKDVLSRPLTLDRLGSKKATKPRRKRRPQVRPRIKYAFYLHLNRTADRCSANRFPLPSNTAPSMAESSKFGNARGEGRPLTKEMLLAAAYHSSVRHVAR